MAHGVYPHAVGRFVSPPTRCRRRESQSYPRGVTRRNARTVELPRGEKIPRKFSPRRGLGPCGQSGPGAPERRPTASRSTECSTVQTGKLPRRSTVLADPEREPSHGSQRNEGALQESNLATAADRPVRET